MTVLHLRVVEDTDIPLLKNWLSKEYILKWYHEPDEWLHEINERKGTFSWIHHFIVMKETEPIGFCQYYDCFDANELEDWYTVTQRDNTYSIDYLIGNEDYLGKGYGKKIVRLLTTTISTNKRAKEIIVQPDKENEASNHVLMANGYIFDSEKNYYIRKLG